MKNSFIPYEIAELAKETGFCEICLGYYLPEDETKTLYNKKVEHDDRIILAPSYQQILDWLSYNFKARCIDITFNYNENIDITENTIIKGLKYKF